MGSSDLKIFIPLRHCKCCDFVQCALYFDQKIQRRTICNLRVNLSNIVQKLTNLRTHTQANFFFQTSLNFSKAMIFLSETGKLFQANAPV